MLGLISLYLNEKKKKKKIGMLRYIPLVWDSRKQNFILCGNIIKYEAIDYCKT